MPRYLLTLHVADCRPPVYSGPQGDASRVYWATGPISWPVDVEVIGEITHRARSVTWTWHCIFPLGELPESLGQRGLRRLQQALQDGMRQCLGDEGVCVGLPTLDLIDHPQAQAQYLQDNPKGKAFAGQIDETCPTCDSGGGRHRAIWKNDKLWRQCQECNGEWPTEFTFGTPSPPKTRIASNAKRKSPTRRAVPDAVARYTCQRCGGEWHARSITNNIPKVCPHCGDPNWRKPRGIPVSMPGEAYCARCRLNKPYRNHSISTTQNGRRILMGQCAECGATVSRLIKSSADVPAIEPVI